ncbi:hypothetical protein RFI_04046, partial [Reticulomyxa filosa]
KIENFLTCCSSAQVRNNKVEKIKTNKFNFAFFIFESSNDSNKKKGNSELCSQLKNFAFVDLHKQFKKYNNNYYRLSFGNIDIGSYVNLIVAFQFVQYFSFISIIRKTILKTRLLKLLLSFFYFNVLQKKMEMTKEMLSDQRDPKVSERLIANKNCLNLLLSIVVLNEVMRRNY